MLHHPCDFLRPFWLRLWLAGWHKSCTPCAPQSLSLGAARFSFRALWPLGAVSALLTPSSVVSRPSHPLSYIVINDVTGRILTQCRGTLRRSPASLCKLMTLRLIFIFLQKGYITLDSKIWVSPRASAQPRSHLGAPAHTHLTIRECLPALALRSANDVAVAVAENLGGLYRWRRLHPGSSKACLAKIPKTFLAQKASYQAFMALMNQEAKTLAMASTHFTTPSGWESPKQQTSPQDLARLLHAMWRDHPQRCAVLSLPFHKTRFGLLRNHNRLQGKIPGILMGKTGFTCPAGYNLALMVARGGRRAIIIIMGAHSLSHRESVACALIKCYVPLGPAPQQPKKKPPLKAKATPRFTPPSLKRRLLAHCKLQNL